MGPESRTNRWHLTLTIVIGFLLTIVPLPDAVRMLRPNFLLLFAIYWSLTAPRIAGLTFSWICGLLIDVLKGAVLGQHALAFLTVGFMTHRLQLRMRNFPIWHQTMTVFMMLAIYEFLIFWIDGIVDQPVTTWMRWLPVSTSAILWPVVVAVMDTLNRRRR